MKYYFPKEQLAQAKMRRLLTKSTLRVFANKNRQAEIKCVRGDLLASELSKSLYLLTKEKQHITLLVLFNRNYKYRK